MQKPRHEVTINLSVTVAGDDVDWKENLAGAIMNLSFHVADLETVVSNGAIFPIGDKGDVDTGTYKFLLHGCVSKEVQDEMLGYEVKAKQQTYADNLRTELDYFYRRPNKC